jgi:putative tryptophan/tyrosine transport system substrate-binding protein
VACRYSAGLSTISRAIAGSLFFDPMRELGWVDSQNVVFEQRASNEQPELLRILARKLIASRVDVIVACPSTALSAAKEATATIPIVFVEVSQPVRQGLVVSLRGPGESSRASRMSRSNSCLSASNY